MFGDQTELSLTTGGEYQVEPLPFVVGAQDLLVVAYPQGGTRGYLLYSDPRILTEVRCRLTCEDDGESHHVRLNANGAVIATGLPAGSYAFALDLHRKRIKSFSGIVVKWGEVTKPSELQGHRVRTEREYLDLRVLDPDGEALVGAKVGYAATPRKGGSRGETEANSAGLARILAKPGESLDLWVTLPYGWKRNSKRQMLIAKALGITLPHTIKLQWNAALGKVPAPRRR